MTVKVKNNKISNDTWVGQFIAAGDHFEIPEYRLAQWRSDNKVSTDIGSGDLEIVKSEGPFVYYSAVEAQKIYAGIPDLVSTGGQGYEFLCTNTSGVIVWSPGTVAIQEEGVQVGSIPFNTLNFIGSDITATDAGSGQANITVTSSGGGFTEFAETSDETESSTTSATFVEKLKMTTASLPNGTYRIGWYCEIKNDDPSGKINLQVQLDDTTNLADVKWEPKDALNYIIQSGFKYEVLTGIHNIDIDFFQEGFGTAFIRKVRLEIWKVA